MNTLSSRSKTSLSLLLILFSITLSAQENTPSLSKKPENKDNFWHRVSVGGNLGCQFGSVTGVNIAPEIAVRTIDNLHVGVRGIYQFYRYKDYFHDVSNDSWKSYSTHVYGGGVFLRYYLYSIFDSFLGNLFAHGEYEYLYYIRPYEPSSTGNYIDPFQNRFAKGRDVVEVSSIFLGGGYRQPVGNRVFFDLLVLFNLNDSNNSPYNNPVIRIGVAVGL